MKKYKIYAQYSAYGPIYVEAENETILKNKLKDDNFIKKLELPTRIEYLEDSFEIDLETITEV